MEVIEHYKKKLLRHIEEPDVVLYCLKKLDAVPVTIEILQDSEVGKVVNRLKKRTDTTPDVIEASKTLVEKWKELVKNTNEDETEIPTAEVLTSLPLFAIQFRLKYIFFQHKNHEAVTSKSKTPSSSSSEKKSSKSHHHKKDKKEKKSSSSSTSSSSTKHHKSSSKESSKKSNGSSSAIEIPSDINPNYKPPKIRHFAESSSQHGEKRNGSKVNTEDDDMLSRLITGNKSLRNRTAVYSGRKTSAFSRDEKFPTLEELCVHVLQDNIHLIDECGSASFDQLKPILERAKADDLIRIEDFNPRLMEDTGKVYEFCSKNTMVLKKHA